MSYKKKQYIGLGLTVFFMFLLMFVILTMMDTIKANMLEIVQDRYNKVDRVTNIRQELYQRDRDLVHLLTENRENVDPNAKVIQDSESYIDVSERLISLETILNRNKSKVLINEVKNSYEKYAAMESDILKQFRNGVSESELMSIYDNQISNRNHLFSKMDEFKSYQESLMNESLRDATTTYNQLVVALVVVISIAIILIASVMLWIIRSTTLTMNGITQAIKNVNFDDLSSIPRMDVKTKDEFGEIATAYNTMAASIEDLTLKEMKYSEEIHEQNWIESHSVEIVKLYGRHTSVVSLADQFIRQLTPIIGGSLGAFYLKDESESVLHFKKVASYADTEGSTGRTYFNAGEGLIGQCVEEKKEIGRASCRETV